MTYGDTHVVTGFSGTRTRGLVPNASKTASTGTAKMKRRRRDSDEDS